MNCRRRFPARLITVAAVFSLTVALLPLQSQSKPAPLTDQEKAISLQLRQLRPLPDKERAELTSKLAAEIAALPLSLGKVRLAAGLAGLSTETDCGRQILQQVTTTLSRAIQDFEKIDANAKLPYGEVAQLVRFEGLQTSLNSAAYLAAVAELDTTNRLRAAADFTLTDLHGATWTLSQLRGKVVVVNFWATWCPPCRKEIPDLASLYEEFKGKGLVVLGISDEEAAKLSEYAAAKSIPYPILLDARHKLQDTLHIEGIPKSFVYDRNGKLVAQAIDVRTRRQFLEMLAQAGLQ